MKAEERTKQAGEVGGKHKGKENLPDPSKGQTRDQVAKQAGFGSGKNYEKLKAEERMKSTLKQNKDDTAMENLPEREKGTTRDQVAKQTGFGSGKNYDKAKYVAENADLIFHPSATT